MAIPRYRGIGQRGLDNRATICAGGPTNSFLLSLTNGRSGDAERSIRGGQVCVCGQGGESSRQRVWVVLHVLGLARAMNRPERHRPSMRAARGTWSRGRNIRRIVPGGNLRPSATRGAGRMPLGAKLAWTYVDSVQQNGLDGRDFGVPRGGEKGSAWTVAGNGNVTGTTSSIDFSLSEEKKNPPSRENRKGICGRFV